MAVVSQMVSYAQNTKPAAKSKTAPTKTVAAAQKPESAAKAFVPKQGVHMTFEKEHIVLGDVKKGKQFALDSNSRPPVALSLELWHLGCISSIRY